MAERSDERPTSQTIKLLRTHKAVKQMILERHEKVYKIQRLADQSKKQTEREKLESAELFRDLIGSIERSQAELNKLMDEKQKAADKQAEGFIQDLQQEITELKRKETELEQLLNTEEHLNLLQVYPSICTPPPTKNWTEINMNTDLNAEDVRRTLSELQKTLNKKLNQTREKTELKRIQMQYAVDVTLDPETASPYLILSEDEKQVSCGNTRKNLPDTPKRFTRYSIVLGKQSFSSGRFYYEVQVGKKPEWDVGVCKESVNRKTEIKLTPQDGFWTVVLRNENEYKACVGPSTILSLKAKPQKVGVFVDYEEGLVSFYDVGNRSHIYSFTGQSFIEKIYPYFWPGDDDKYNNLAPLIISPVITTE